MLNNVSISSFYVKEKKTVVILQPPWFSGSVVSSCSGIGETSGFESLCRSSHWGFSSVNPHKFLDDIFKLGPDRHLPHRFPNPIPAWAYNINILLAESASSPPQWQTFAIGFYPGQEQASLTDTHLSEITSIILSTKSQSSQRSLSSSFPTTIKYNTRLQNLGCIMFFNFW
jgi:hypothetical protein